MFKKIAIPFFSISLIFSSCSTDFELNAPYETIPVVYGLLDQSKDTQFVKINRSFLGYGNNVDYAAINDCTHFENVVAVLEEYNEFGNLIDHDTLKELMVGNLQPGIFYEDSQKVYYLETDNDSLKEENTYHLKVSVPDKGLNFDAETDLIKGTWLNFKFQTILYLAGSGFKVADVDLATTEDGYLEQTLRWTTAERGKRYELMLRLHYTEVYNDLSEQEKYLEWNLGRQISVSSSGGEEMFKDVSGGSFFNFVETQLQNYENEDQVMKRVLGMDAIEIILTAGNEDLNTYMQVNEPVTGIVTERPIFTNVNNGIGIFASKYSTKVSTFLSDGSMLEICAGQKTSGFKFCCDSANILPQNSATQAVAISLLTGGVNVGCD
tara:strand:+ start:1951 stop:3090 length:1140 start_codon:yes stop_codon:yes gene_type:complete